MSCSCCGPPTTPELKGRRGPLGPAGGTFRQWLLFGAGFVDASSRLAYLQPGGMGSSISPTGEIPVRVPFGGFVTSLVLDLRSAVSEGSLTVTVVVNGVPTSLAVTVTAAEAVSWKANTSTTVILSQFDKLTVSIATTEGTIASRCAPRVCLEVSYSPPTTIGEGK